MTRRSPLVALVLLAALAGPAALQARQAAQPQQPPTYEDLVKRTWRQLHNKILTMAKDTEFPDDKLGWKPHPDSRSVLDEYRHVTIGLEMSTAQLKGDRTFNYQNRMNADAGKPATRASVVSEMEAALAASVAAVDAQPSPTLIFWIDHQAEHYGKLVSNYRMLGIVPPVSRGRQ